MSELRTGSLSAEGDGSTERSGGGDSRPMNLPRYNHIVVVIEENQRPEKVVGLPYLSSLVAGGLLYRNYNAIGYPSQPNYFAAYAGDTHGIKDNKKYKFSAPTLASVLSDHGKSFTGFVEEDTSRRHRPWTAFRDRVEASIEEVFHQRGFHHLPDVSFVVPDNEHNSHDGSRKRADRWLSKNVSAYAEWAKTHNSLLAITWDEDDGEAKRGRERGKIQHKVALILYGAHVRPGSVDNGRYDHYSLLASVCEMTGLPRHVAPGRAKSAQLFNPAYFEMKPFATARP